MSVQNSTNTVSTDIVVKFLSGILPFKNLSSNVLKNLSRKCVIDFFPMGTIVFKQGVTAVEQFYVIQKGGVKTYLKSSETEINLKDYRGVGEYFGALAIIQDSKANLTVETVEDTFCFLFDKTDFLELINSYPEVAQYYLRKMSAKLVNTVYSEFRKKKINPRDQGALYLFSAKVGDLAKGKLHCASTTISVQDAAKTMSDNMIGSLLLTDTKDKIVGIVTDKDIRQKVVAQGLSFTTKVAEIMASPVRSISSQAVCFDALLEMIRDKIHHLAIEQNGVIKGMITTHDIMVAQGTSPLYLFREILAQRNTNGLYALSKKIPLVVRSLIEEGAKANNVTRMIAVLNDHILDRLLSLMIDEFGKPPVPFCWLLVGSEGRREQTFKTDQDNGIIYDDISDPRLAKEAQEYFSDFAEVAIHHLVKCGYPLCPGEIMASNPLWRQPLETWKGYFQKWCKSPTPKSVLNSTIFFDFKCGFGHSDLAKKLRSSLTEMAAKEDIFLTYLARNCLATRPPLSFFKNFIVEKDGEHKDTFDLKTKGLVYIVDFARLMALKHRITETNTMARLQLLQEGNYINKGLCTEIIESYEFLMQLRLVHQLQMMENKLEPDNHLNPKDISDLERQTLKEAFAVIGRLQELLKQEFHVTDF